MNVVITILEMLIVRIGTTVKPVRSAGNIEAAECAYVNNIGCVVIPRNEVNSGKLLIGRRGTTTDIQGASLERGGIRDLRILAY